MLASIAPGVPFALAGQLAYPGRQSITVVGDGGFAMLMAELTRAIAAKFRKAQILLKFDFREAVILQQNDLDRQVVGHRVAEI